jgi:hypothetical protein
MLVIWNASSPHIEERSKLRKESAYGESGCERPADRADDFDCAGKRRGEQPVTVIVSEQDIDFLMARGYLETRDKESISWAVSAFLSDSVLEGA